METLLGLLALVAAAASCWVVQNGEIVKGNVEILASRPDLLLIENFHGIITKKLLSNLQEKNIGTMYMKNNSIDDIEDGALCASPLVEIEISKSFHLPNLTKEMFGTCPSLVTLELHGTKNVYLGKDLLSVFPNLESLFLQHYPTIEDMTAENFRGLDKLRYLTVRCTSLKKINAEVFSHMAALGILKIQSNKVDTVEGVFANTELHYLELNSNKLKTFPWDALKNLGKLWSFVIADNPMTEYDADKIVKYAPNLVKFIYGDNSSCAENHQALEKKLKEGLIRENAIVRCAKCGDGILDEDYHCLRHLRVDNS